MRKFYVVWVGREPGIYTNWPDCNRQIIGFKGAKFKSFTDYDEANEAFNNPELNASSGKQAFASYRNASMAELLEGFRYAIFCDGGCYPNPGPSGTGMAIYSDGIFQSGFYGCFQKEGTNNTAELYGLLQALDFVDFLVSDCDVTDKVVIYCDSQYSLNAVSNWGYAWAKNGWRKKDDEPIKNVSMIRSAHEAYIELADYVVFRHVKGHQGIEGNELADQLATLARTSQEQGWVKVEDMRQVA
jgi:ribonuclease HI